MSVDCPIGSKLHTWREVTDPIQQAQRKRCIKCGRYKDELHRFDDSDEEEKI